MLTQTGFVDIQVGSPIDTFGGARGEPNARRFKVYGYSFLARKPAEGQALMRLVEDFKHQRFDYQSGFAGAMRALKRQPRRETEAALEHWYFPR